MLVAGPEILQQPQNLTLRVKHLFHESRNMMRNIQEGKHFLHKQLQEGFLSLVISQEQANLSNLIFSLNLR